MYEYDAAFYRYDASFAVRSAQRIVPKLTALLTIRSVVDFGCGEGAWLSVWRNAGAAVFGVDGPYIRPDKLRIDPADFAAADLAEPIDLGRRFDLVQSLEVAEHLPAERAAGFIDTLAAHGSRILFSAAVPGQGGEHHINERPLEYWRAIFRERGFAAVDCLRPLICDDATIERWYRYNTLLYVKDCELRTLSEPISACRVPDDKPLREYRPMPRRVRDSVVRRLPGRAVDRLSRLKAGLVARGG